MKKVTVFQSLIKSELLINTSILVSGSAFAQLIPVLLRPVLTRPFSAEMFGAYSVYGSIIGILVIISSLKYELAIILPGKDKEAANIFFLSIILNLIFNTFLLFIVIIWKKPIIHFLSLSDSFANYLYLIPFGTFLLSSYQSINYWLIRKKKFTPVTINKFIRRSFEGGSQVGLKLINIPHFLVYGDIIGHIANILSGIYQGSKNGLTINLLSTTKIKYVFLKYIDYPKYSLIPGIMSACSTLLPAILINKFFSLENAGFMDTSKLVLSIPIALISLSVSSVLMQRTSDKFKNNESIKKDLLVVLAVVTIIGILEIIIISFFGEELFKFIFGDQWGFSGILAKILVWSFALNFIVNSFNSIFISLNKIKLLSFWQLFYFLSILSLIFFKNYSFLAFVKIYVFIEIMCAFIITYLMLQIVRKYEFSLKHV
jgi:O-antigen/teichoic acid export membrane protein